jgi:hypothetical protein
MSAERIQILLSLHIPYCFVTKAMQATEQASNSLYELMICVT